jgi:hypothetical protein
MCELCHVKADKTVVGVAVHYQSRLHNSMHEILQEATLPDNDLFCSTIVFTLYLVFLEHIFTFCENLIPSLPHHTASSIHVLSPEYICVGKFVSQTDIAFCNRKYDVFRKHIYLSFIQE